PMLRGRSPSCGRTSDFCGPSLIWVHEIHFAAELQQWKAVLRKRHGLPAEFLSHARIVEYSVKRKIRHEYFHQSRAVAYRTLAIREQFHCRSKWPLDERQVDGAALILRRRQRGG